MKNVMKMVPSQNANDNPVKSQKKCTNDKL